jgi:hypothetical protein
MQEHFGPLRSILPCNVAAVKLPVTCFLYRLGAINDAFHCVASTV